MHYRPSLSSVWLVAVSLGILVGPAAAARAQDPQSQLGGCRLSEMQGASQEMLTKEVNGRTERVLVLTGTGGVGVRVDCDDMQFFADYAEVYLDSNRVIATSNVRFGSGNSVISAERMEFDTKTRVGTFYNAAGWASMGDRVDRSMFGTQEADAMFRGKEVHKIGPKKYRIVDGAFTTCVQPTPRWEIVSGSATLNLDDYALLKNSVFRVKGVPLLYLPIFYYPIQEDDRATGFLLPTYGTSTIRGASWSNAFFWAISRSQDATLMHDWFTKTGQQVGGEYRYQLGGGSQGAARASLLSEKETTDANGTVVPGKTSYRINGGVSQNLGGGFRARADADYFSDLAAQQKYQQNVYFATNRIRRFGGNVTGNWSEYVLSATLDRSDIFYPTGDITTNGGLPRINLNRGERRIGRSPLYFGFNTEAVTILRSTTNQETTIEDRGLSRFDVNPGVRIPFTRWPFLTVNSTVSWRGTWWSESLRTQLNPSGNLEKVQVPESIWRQFFDLNALITGPVFTRIFNAGKESGTKFKHVIQPIFGIQHKTGFDVYPKIVQLETIDYEYPDTTRFTYGLTNRLYAKKDSAREVLLVSLTQSYYTQAIAAQYDQQFQSSFTATSISNYSPLRLVVRSAPTTRLQGEFQTEWDAKFRTMRTLAAAGSVNTSRIQATAGWSRRRFIPGLSGFDNPAAADHYLNASVNWHGLGNRVGGTYAFNYDLRRDTFLQQRILGYFNAQCCGVAVEYQTFNFGNTFVPSSALQDRRFNISFTLAGIGTFSNLLGAFGGQ
jgi:LPS-assembly protein